MDRLSGLLHRRPSEGGAFTAAFVVATINRVLLEEFQFDVQDARATSFRNGSVVIRVSHGAVAGRIQQQSTAIVTQSNARLERLGASKLFQVTELRTRVS